jgi:hypothetical protein
MVLLVGLVLAGCGESPLSNLGDVSGGWLSASPTPPTTAPVSVLAEPVQVNLYRAGADAEIDWVNDRLGDPRSSHPADAIAHVWSRSSKEDRYVQASRSEIAVALPGLQFPNLIPENVEYITSQLVFEPGTGLLSDEAIAAFGFWSAEPYSKSRSVAQLAVLMVSPDPTPSEVIVPDTIGVPDDPPEDTRCEDLTRSTVKNCVPMTLENGDPAWSLKVSNGWRLVWQGHGYEYDLFVRNAANTDVLARMAGSVEDLASPFVGVVAGEPAENQLDGEGDPADS